MLLIALFNYIVEYTAFPQHVQDQLMLKGKNCLICIKSNMRYAFFFCPPLFCSHCLPQAWKKTEPYPFLTSLSRYGMDLNGARRKNATRETTSTLKAWLNEHKKNPYPTKGEKIMLAIITKMTLTQVSTWFANARRRLKKENKMTWEPRNRVEDDDVNLDDDDHKSNDEKDLLGK